MANTDIALFKTEWKRYHDGRWPVGWMLRKSQDLPWIRFHALPGSKRYPENQDEMRIILERAYTLADNLLGEGTPCWLVTTVFTPAKPDPTSAGEFPDDDDEEWVWRFHAAPTTWRQADFIAHLTDIAHDRAPHSLWLSRTNGAIFAPYDGGFDLFPAAFGAVSALKARYGDWLSPHPEGL